jgi:hypothetical protein
MRLVSAKKYIKKFMLVLGLECNNQETNIWGGGKTFTSSLNICPEVYCREGGQSNGRIFPPHPVTSWSFKDDVTNILYFGVSLIVTMYDIWESVRAYR